MTDSTSSTAISIRPLSQYNNSIFTPQATNKMRFSAISFLFVAAAAVDAAAVEKRACVEYIGNSWGCGAPVGEPQNWNYCQVQDPNYPVFNESLWSHLKPHLLTKSCGKLCTHFYSGGLTSARCCNQ